MCQEMRARSGSRCSQSDFDTSVGDTGFPIDLNVTFGDEEVHVKRSSTLTYPGEVILSLDGATLLHFMHLSFHFFSSFSELDAWIRQRFEVPANTQLAFYASSTEAKSKGGAMESEIIPNGTLGSLVHLKVKTFKAKKHQHLIKREPPSCRLWKHFLQYGPFLLLLLFAW